MIARILFITAVLSWPAASYAQPSIVHRPPQEGPHLTFQMDATAGQIHAFEDSSGAQLIFPGHIASDVPVIWILTPLPTRAYGPPNLSLVQDVLGHDHPTGQTVIPLTWEFALDGGSFARMTLTPENDLQVIIPPGMHVFQLRAVSPPLMWQAAGYYRIQMSMTVVPRL